MATASRFADDVLRGWHVREAVRDVLAEVQHEFARGVSATAGYYRNWEGNYRVTDNVAVGPEDYNPYCIAAPSDPRLPGGGGYPVCGFYGLNPVKFETSCWIPRWARAAGPPMPTGCVRQCSPEPWALCASAAG